MLAMEVFWNGNKPVEKYIFPVDTKFNDAYVQFAACVEAAQTTRRSYKQGNGMVDTNVQRINLWEDDIIMAEEVF